MTWKEIDERKDFLRDHGSGGWEETPYRKPVKKKKHVRTPCPENDGGPHVYIWTPLVYEEFPDHITGYEVRICCGCGKHAGRGKQRWRRNHWRRGIHNKNFRRVNK